MPTYQYACTACDHRFEAVQPFTDPSLTVCPECSGGLRKVYGSVGVVFKGSGFYRTDARNGAGDGAAVKGEKAEKLEKSEGSGKSEKSDSGASKSDSSSSSKSADSNSGGAAASSGGAANSGGASSSSTSKGSGNSTGKATTGAAKS